MSNASVPAERLEALADKYRGLRVLRQMRSASEVEDDLRALLAEAREEGKPLPPEDVIARLTFNSDGEEIGREMARRIMYALRHDYQWLYTKLNPDIPVSPPASAVDLVYLHRLFAQIAACCQSDATAYNRAMDGMAEIDKVGTAGTEGQGHDLAMRWGV